MKTSSSRDRGASLISVLVIVMLMSLAALAATDGLARAVDSARTSGFRADTFWTARGAAYAAETYLTDLIGKTGRNLTAESEVWSQSIVLPVKRGIVSANIRERTNCFNLSGLQEDSDEFAVREDRLAAFEVLLVAAGVNETEALSLSRNLEDWMVSSPSHRRTPENVSELLTVQGFSPELLSDLEELVCVLGTREQPLLNLNTMKAEHAPLLVSLFSPELSSTEARYLIEDRPRTGWPDLSLVWEQDSVKRINPDARNDGAISLQSTFFEVDLSIQNGAGRTVYKVLYGPDEDTGSEFLSMERRVF